MNVSRRWFIGGAAAFGAFGGARVFAANGFSAGGKPNLTFGIISDVHLSRMAGDPEKDIVANCANFLKTLKAFDAAGVDAVVIAGDLINDGVIPQLEQFALVWRSVFPNDRASDGRHVEKLFVTGNHDMCRLGRSRGRCPNMTDADIAEKMMFFPRLKSVWERVFDEPYAPIWKKEVKGYSFVGAHWLQEDCRGKDEAFNPGLVDFYTAKAKAFDPKKPFFHIQHPHPKDTCYGHWAWGRDVGLSTKALSAFPNAVAISGHSHYPLTDERSIWQGAFTSIGTASLRYLGETQEEIYPTGYENTRAMGPNTKKIDGAKITPRYWSDGVHGMVARVYDDCMTFERRDYVYDQKLGADWVVPFGADRPFAFAEHARKLRAPQFAAGAKLVIGRQKVKNRDGKEMDGIRVFIPSVQPDPAARAYSFVVKGVGSDGKTVTKKVLARGHGSSLEHEHAKQATYCAFAASEFAQGAVTFTVTPENCFHAKGKPLTGSIGG